MKSRWRFRLTSRHCWLLAVLAITAVTEARALDPAKAFSQYIATNWNIQNGLSQKTVNAIAQTDDGFLWLGTEEGLVRYDGLNFVAFDERNASGLDDRVIRSLAPTPGGGLWVGTSTGLVRYKQGHFSSLREQTQFFIDVYDLAVTRDGSVWFSSDSGLRRYTEAGRVPGFHLYTTADGLPTDGITGLVKAEDETLWIGTRHGLVHYAGDRFTTYPCPSFSKMPGDITSLAVGHGGGSGHAYSVWVGMSDGSIAKWSDGRIAPVWQGRATAGASVWSMREDHDGTLWVAFRKVGLGRLRDGSMKVLTRSDGLPSTSPDWIFEDREKNLWVGWVDMGMSMFRDGQFTVFGRSEGMFSEVISSLATAAGGELWVGMEDAGINRLSEADGEFKVWPAGLSSGASGSGVMAVLQQRDGTLWVGSDHGSVTRIQNGRATTFQVPGTLTPGLDSIVEDENGEPWFGFDMPNGLARLRNGRFEFQQIPGKVRDLAMAPDGSLWIAAYAGGLIQYRDGVVRTYTQEDGLANLALTSVFVGADGAVWAGTMLGGIVRLMDGKITRYSIEQGLSDSTVGDIVADTEGNLWLAGTRGIMRVSLKELNTYAAGGLEKVTVRTFGFADGLRSTECNFEAHPAALRDEKGRLWFATLSGLAMIDPGHIRRDEVAPKPLAMELIANGRTVVPGPEGYSIKPGQKALSVRIAAPGFIAPEQMQIRYRLVGSEDEAWVRADPRQRRIPFENLAPGWYRFEVQAANSDGVSSGETGTLSFYVLPHYYQTWWFRLLAAGAMLLAVWVSLRLRTERLLRKNRDLEALILEKTAEVRSALEAAEESREMLRELALRDTLTGLWNRRAIFEILETQIRQCAKEGRPLTIMMADIDHFKSINDTWGHQAGDDVIREVGRRLSEGVRRTDAVGRYGGEELLILLPDAPLAQGMERAEALREAVCRDPVDVDGLSIKVSCSFGLTYIKPGSSLSDIVGHADAALYRAKHEGRNCVRLQLPIETAKAS